MPEDYPRKNCATCGSYPPNTTGFIMIYDEYICGSCVDELKKILGVKIAS